MKKLDKFEIWLIEHIRDFWIRQDKHFNERALKLYETLYQKYKKDDKLKTILKNGLECLYAERKQIKLREADLRSETRRGVLKWSGSRASKQV